ncbi:phosphoribosylformylglycinamidine synthase subunit PurQ [bacterium]|nr:phosphoribosylformylglycinamidine synthase subunit PurQ [bacterium]
MKFGVIVFPGSNCDHDSFYTLENVVKQEVVSLWHKDHDLQNVDAIIVPGGFSYGDYLRCGAIARFSPIMNEVVNFANKGGIVLGICNGFQILTEAGLLEGVLTRNQNRRFACKNIFLSVQNNKTKFSQGLEKSEVLQVPIAHGEGNFFAPQDTVKRLEDNGQIVFRYCNKDGEITSESNPNGSINNIAGIINKNGNILGMMPHPERCSDKTLGNSDGKKIFEAMIKSFLV